MDRQSFEDVCRLMNLPTAMIERTAAIMRDSSGNYLLQDRGDVGYNRFLGRPSAPHAGPGRDRMLQVWRSLSDARRRRAIAAAIAMRIDLARDFGVPTADVALFQVIS